MMTGPSSLHDRSAPEPSVREHSVREPSARPELAGWREQFAKHGYLFLPAGAGLHTESTIDRMAEIVAEEPSGPEAHRYREHLQGIEGYSFIEAKPDSSPVQLSARALELRLQLLDLYRDELLFVTELPETAVFRRMQTNELQVGHRLALHCDAEVDPLSEVGLVVGLNDEYEGGETGVSGRSEPLKLGRGDLLLLGSRTLHWVEPVTGGMKHSLLGLLGRSDAPNPRNPWRSSLAMLRMMGGL